MKQKTFELANLYLKEGKREIAKAVIDLDESLNKLVPNSNHYKACIYNHTLSSIEALEYYNETGDCPECMVIEESISRTIEGSDLPVIDEDCY